MRSRSQRDERGGEGARAVVLIIFIFVLIAGGLGLATGSFNADSIRMKVPTPSDPITVP